MKITAMKVNFKSFKTSEQVERFFQSQIVVGSSTSTDVISLLNELGLRHSSLVDTTNKKVFRTPDYPFDYAVTSYAPTRPTLLIFSNKWHIYFHFDKDKILTKVSVRKFGDGGY